MLPCRLCQVPFSEEQPTCPHCGAIRISGGTAASSAGRGPLRVVLAVGGALTLVVLLAVGGLAMHLAGVAREVTAADGPAGAGEPADDEAPSPPAATRDAAPLSFASTPSADWVVTPADFLDGHQGTFFGVDYFSPQAEPPAGGTGVITADTVAIGVTDVLPGDDGGGISRVVGIDPDDGSMQWSFDDGLVTCFDLPTQGLACVGEDLHVVDPATGEVETIALNPAFDERPSVVVDAPGDAFYTIEWQLVWDDATGEPSGLEQISVGRWSPQGEEWAEQYDMDPAHGFYRGIVSADATEDRLSLDFEGEQLLLDSADGRLLDTGDNSEGTQPNPFGLEDPVSSLLQGEDPQTATRDDLVLTADPSARTLRLTDGDDELWSRTLPDLEGMASEQGFDDGLGGLGFVRTGFARRSVIVTSTVLVEGFTGFGSGTAPIPDDVTEYRTPCGKEPEVEPVEARGEDGAVEIVLEFHAVCPGGQWVDGGAVHLRFEDGGTGDGSGSSDGTVLGDASYDFSRTPLWLPGPDDGDETGPAVVTTVSLPPGSAFATSAEIQARIRTVVVPCEGSAGSTGEDDAPSGDDDDAADGSGVLYSPYAPGETDRDRQNDDALAALRRIAAADRSAVSSDLEGAWVPQLSSKKDGTTDRVDQHTYDYADILAEHLRLRETYPDVRLLFSSEWKSFQMPGYWVTVVGQTESAPEPVLSFCEAEGFPISHCFAKRVLADGPQEGSTRSRG